MLSGGKPIFTKVIDKYIDAAYAPPVRRFERSFELQLILPAITEFAIFLARVQVDNGFWSHDGKIDNTDFLEQKGPV